MSFHFRMRGETIMADSLADLSAEYSKRRNASGEGGSTFPSPTVYQDSKRLGYISYNGRIWPGHRLDRYDPEKMPIYDNRVPA